MIIIKTCLIIACVLIFASLSQAQGADTGCALTPAQLSSLTELKGFRPGMTVEEVKAIVPSLEMGALDEFGLSKTSFSPVFNPKINKLAFQGVRTISLDFLDGRVSAVWIGYDETFKWKSIAEVVKWITQSLKLTPDWETKGRGQQLACGDLLLTVTMVGGSPTLRITDETASRTWEKRRTDKAQAEP